MLEGQSPHPRPRPLGMTLLPANRTTSYVAPVSLALLPCA